MCDEICGGGDDDDGGGGGGGDDDEEKCIGGDGDVFAKVHHDPRGRTMALTTVITFLHRTFNSIIIRHISDAQLAGEVESLRR